MNSLVPSVFIALIALCAIGGIDGLKCFECKSKDHKTCGDPYNSTELAHFLIECPPAPQHLELHTNETEAKFCRKLKQTIDGKTQVVSRSCGYLKNDETREEKACFKDAFSSFTSSIYCDCSFDACNHANPGKVFSSILSLLVAFVLSFQLISTT